MNIITLVDQITNFHHDAIVRWKQTGVQTEEHDLMGAVEANHAYNYQLWHAEDRARRSDMGSDFIVAAKREIDQCNQRRNNEMEKIDQFIIGMLNPAPYENCKVHSETPGMMIDRLSILALKIYHMHLQTIRDDVDSHHIQQCNQKLQQLKAQKEQLSTCLKELLIEVENKTRTFRIYQQHKMYNDPKLNPELYQTQIVK
jgi:hypothetical protein